MRVGSESRIFSVGFSATTRKFWMVANPEATEKQVKAKFGARTAKAELLECSRRIYSVKDGVLHADGLRVVPNCPSGQILEKAASPHLQTHFLMMAHFKAMHDYQGTLWVLENEYNVFWPNMSESARVFELNCLHCLAEKAALKFAAQENEVYERRDQAWFFDLQGPFGPEKYTLVSCICDATGFGWLRLIRKKDRLNVLCALKSILREVFPDVFDANGVPHEEHSLSRHDWLEIIRSDNGFVYDFGNWLKELSKRVNLPRVRHVIGTSENPQGQHRIERPHKLFRAWVNSIESIEVTGLTKEIVRRMQTTWRNRPIHAKFRVTPGDMYYGRTVTGTKDILEAHYERVSERLARCSRFARLRRATSEQGRLIAARKPGLVTREREPKPGDCVLLLYMKENRRSKRDYTGNYRKQVFLVTARKGLRAFLRSAAGDQRPKFAQPVSIRKLRVVSPRWKQILDFS